MRNKIVMITAALAVMMAMTGIAAAYITVSPSNIEVDINDPNPATLVTVTFNPEGGDLPTGLQFTINDNQYGTGSFTTEITGSADGGSNYIGYIGTLPLVVPSGGIYTWTFYVKDALDTDDSTQFGNKYRVVFDVLGTTGSISYVISSTPTVAAAVPEFATIALPIAAVLGLVFFFQQRKIKKE